MARSAIVNDITNIVENICVADPITPSPYAGYFMVGLEDPIFEEQINTYTAIHPAGTIVTVDQNGTIVLTLPNGTEEIFPPDTTVTNNPDGTITTSFTVTEIVMIVPGTPCGIGWVYDPATEKFSPPLSE